VWEVTQLVLEYWTACFHFIKIAIQLAYWSSLCFYIYVQKEQIR